jgi:hypothetical protein
MKYYDRDELGRQGFDREQFQGVKKTIPRIARMWRGSVSGFVSRTTLEVAEKVRDQREKSPARRQIAGKNSILLSGRDCRHYQTQRRQARQEGSPGRKPGVSQKMMESPGGAAQRTQV